MNKCITCKVFRNCLVSDLKKQELSKLDGCLIQTMIADGERIFEAGKSAHSIYMVVEGEVKMDYSDHEMQSVTMHIARDGDCIGLEGLMPGRKYLLSAVACGDTTVCTIKKNCIDMFIATNKDVYNKIMNELQNRQEMMFNYSKLMIGGPAVGKLAFALVTLSDKNRVIISRQEELASMARIRRETVSRLLSKLKTDEVIRINKREIVILKRSELERLMNDF